MTNWLLLVLTYQGKTTTRRKRKVKEAKLKVVVVVCYLYFLSNFCHFHDAALQRRKGRLPVLFHLLSLRQFPKGKKFQSSKSAPGYRICPCSKEVESNYSPFVDCYQYSSLIIVKLTHFYGICVLLKIIEEINYKINDKIITCQFLPHLNHTCSQA